MKKKRILIFILLITILLTACGKSESPRTKIGIIAALPFEIDILKEAVNNRNVDMIAGTEYVTGSIGNYDVVLMQCGMGKVSAGAGTQALITAYHPDYIINTGCAGALSQSLKVGDIVLADSTIEWDLDTEAIGNPIGYVSSMDRVEMCADSELTAAIAEAIGDSDTVYHGLIVSGDQFVSRSDQRSQILDDFPSALCTEMEGAAVGHVCAQNNVPFCVIRSMSDNANGDSGVDYAEFSVIVGEKTAGYLLKFLNDEGF